MARKARKVRRKLSIWRTVWNIVRWLGWILIIAMALWKIFGGAITNFLSTIASEPANATHAAIEAVSWLRISVEFVFMLVKGR